MVSDKISIIMGIFNCADTLPQAIDSIINQTYKNLEIILVDDGSPDNCGRICDEYAKKDNAEVIVLCAKIEEELSEGKNEWTNI